MILSGGLTVGKQLEQIIEENYQHIKSRQHCKKMKIIIESLKCLKGSERRGNRGEEEEDVGLCWHVLLSI